MYKSKLYDMAAKIAMDKLVPKPVHITISMQGGGGLSNIELPVIKRVSGGDIGNTGEFIGGYTDAYAGADYNERTDDEPATITPVGIGLKPIGPKVESLLPPTNKPPFYTPEQAGHIDIETEDRVMERLKEGVPFHLLSPKEQEVGRVMGISPQGGGRPVRGEYDSYFPKYNSRRNVEQGITLPEGMLQLPPTQGGINQFGFVTFGEKIQKDINKRHEVATDPLLNQLADTWDSIATGELPEDAGEELIREFVDELEIINNQYAKETQELEKNIRDEKKNMSWGNRKYREAATGGQTMPRGLSGLNDSININGQPHRLVWANPQEERVLKDMGGSGKKVDGIPAYYVDDYPSWDIGGGDPAISDPTYSFASDTYAAPTYTDSSSESNLAPVPLHRVLPKLQKVVPEVPEVPKSKLQRPNLSYSGITKSALETGKPVKGLPWLEDAGEETAEQDAGARIAYMTQHIANYPGGRRDPVTQELFSADVDYDRAIDKYGSSMLQTLRDSYAGDQDVFGAMFGHATKLTQDRLNEAINKEIELTPEAEQVDSKEYREGIVDAVLSNPATALKEFGLTDVTKSKGFIDPPKEGSWMDKAKQFLTPTIVKGLDALNQGIPALVDIWGVGKVNGEGVYIKKDGTIIPFKSDTERGNIESGSLRGDNVVTKKLKRRPIQTASAEEVVKEPSPLETLLASRSEVSPLAQLNEEMQERVNRFYNRNIFT